LVIFGRDEKLLVLGQLDGEHLYHKSIDHQKLQAQERLQGYLDQTVQIPSSEQKEHPNQKQRLQMQEVLPIQ